MFKLTDYKQNKTRKHDVTWTDWEHWLDSFCDVILHHQCYMETRLFTEPDVWILLWCHQEEIRKWFWSSSAQTGICHIRDATCNILAPITEHFLCLGQSSAAYCVRRVDVQVKLCYRRTSTWQLNECWLSDMKLFPYRELNVGWKPGIQPLDHETSTWHILYFILWPIDFDWVKRLNAESTTFSATPNKVMSKNKDLCFDWCWNVA